MFDLEKSIADWRRQMLAAGIKTPVPLEELESHLREEVEREIQGGLSAPQAFAAAIQRLGQAQALEAEFAKVLAPTEARERKLKLLCLAAVALAYLTPFVLAAPRPWNGMNPGEACLGLAALTLSVAGMFSGLFVHRFLPVIRDPRVRTCVQFACALPLFVWVGAFAFVIVPRMEWTTAQLSMATLWALSPLGIFGGLICGLDEAADRRFSADRA